MGATCNKPVKIPFPSCAGSKSDICYVGQVSYRETGMKEDTVSDVRQEMAERHQAGCLTPGGGRSAKIRADTHMLIGPAKITLRLFLAITQLLRQNVIKVLEFRKKKVSFE